MEVQFPLNVTSETQGSYEIYYNISMVDYEGVSTDGYSTDYMTLTIMSYEPDLEV